MLLPKNQVSKCFSIIFGSFQININKITFFFWKMFKGLLCFPIHNKNRRIMSFLAALYKLLRFSIQSKNRRTCSFQASFYRFLWFPIQSKNYRFFRFLAGFYRFLCFQIQSNMRLKASCCFTKIKCPNASKSSRLLWFPIQSKNRRICSFPAGVYKFLWFPIQNKKIQIL